MQSRAVSSSGAPASPAVGPPASASGKLGPLARSAVSDPVDQWARLTTVAYRSSPARRCTCPQVCAVSYRITVTAVPTARGSRSREASEATWAMPSPVNTGPRNGLSTG